LTLFLGYLRRFLAGFDPTPPPPAQIDHAPACHIRTTAFTNIVTAKPAEMTHTSLANIKTPEAVQRLVGMLSAYDWEFVQQAKEIRGYTVAKLVEETEHPNANIRLKALGLLGKVTEVGLFTEKIEVKKTEMSDIELEARIKDKLNRFMGVIDVIDVTEDTPDEA
jgi:hypothetical protein